MMALLEVKELTKSYGLTRVLQPTNISIQQGEFVTLLGPSGCGKSTLLRILMGITSISSGQVNLHGTRIDHLPPEKRNISMVFQSYALFPHMNVERNISFGLRMKGFSAEEQKKRMNHAVDICNLESLIKRMPKALSGGQQQRVALARAIVMQPDLLLFDEPLSNLDAKLRESLREDLLGLHKRTGVTSLYVTHDQTEAMTMSDRVIVMNAGCVMEIGTPVELYRSPRTLFTAQFLGQANIFEIKAAGAKGILDWGQCVSLSKNMNGKVNACCRPEDITLISHAQGIGTVTGIQFHGPSTIYDVSLPGQCIKVSKMGQSDTLNKGDRVQIHFEHMLHVLQNDMTTESSSTEVGK
jgi:putative spermidine/putrescine transport system ATP-binding protein